MKRTENMRRHIGETLTIRWGTSRGRDSYGYTTCSLRNHRGERVAACNGGGYDMRGTVIGNWIAATFPNELRALKPSDMPKHSHWQGTDTRICRGKCWEERYAATLNDPRPGAPVEPRELPRLAPDCFECPVCKGKTTPSQDGKTVQDGRYFYGLTFHDPNYDAGKAIVGKDCADRTLVKNGETSEGMTVEQAEAAHVSAGLERYQAFYSASSKIPTKRHTAPLIDGACGESSVLSILQALGLTLRRVADTSKLDVYLIEEYKATN